MRFQNKLCNFKKVFDSLFLFHVQNEDFSKISTEI